MTTARDEDTVSKDWHGLMEIVRDVYPEAVFDGTSCDPGPTIVTLLRRVDTLTRERDEAREDAGHQRAMRKHISEELSGWVQRHVVLREQHALCPVPSVPEETDHA